VLNHGRCQYSCLNANFSPAFPKSTWSKPCSTRSQKTARCWTDQILAAPSTDQIPAVLSKDRIPAKRRKDQILAVLLRDRIPAKRRKDQILAVLSRDQTTETRHHCHSRKTGMPLKMSSSLYSRLSSIAFERLKTSSKPLYSTSLGLIVRFLRLLAVAGAEKHLKWTWKTPFSLREKHTNFVSTVLQKT